MGQGVQAGASAKAGLKLNAKFDCGKAGVPPHLGGDINFTGVVLTVTACNTIRGTQYVSDPITLVDPCPLVQGFVVGHG